MVDTDSVVINTNTVSMTLTLSNAADITTWQPSASLDVVLEFYQNGVLRTVITDPTETFNRFQISDFAGVATENLVAQSLTTDYTTDTTSPLGININMADRTATDVYDFQV